MEEKHSFSLWPGYDTCSRMAKLNCTVAARCYKVINWLFKLFENLAVINVNNINTGIWFIYQISVITSVTFYVTAIMMLAKRHIIRCPANLLSSHTHRVQSE